MIGTSVRHYQIVEQLGHGGMGIVYRAKDTRLDRAVALKFLPPEFSRDERAKARFVREAKAASGLEHPNVCTVHDIASTEDGRLFIVMPFYEGQTLKYRLEDDSASLERSLEIASDLASALHSAHSAGIVHRDLKPANIMITDRGRVVLLDFGIAKLGGDSDLTQEGGTLGTAAYMSPEQARGEELDLRSDLWSLGVVLYQLITGERPFGGGYDHAVLYAVINQEPRNLDSIAADLGEPVGGLLRSLLAKDPNDRPQSAQEVLDILAPLTSRVAGSTVAAPAVVEDPKPASRARWVAGGVAAVILLLVLAVSYGFRGTDHPGLPRNHVAIFPFAINGDESLAYLREGMVNLLGSKLDGAGPLTAVDPNAVIGSSSRFGESTITPDEASRVAAGLGAGSFVLGSVTQIGGVRQIEAALFGPTDTTRVRLDLDGDDGLPAGIDDVARKLIASRLSSEGAGLETAAATMTESFEALKAYLEGESHFRLWRINRAHDAFRSALDADSAFALAWYRLAKTIRWGGGDYDGAIERTAAQRTALDMALENRASLPRRFRTLIEAADAFQLGDIARAGELYTRRLENDPNDLEALTELGDFQMSYNPLVGRPAQEAVSTFSRLAELDPENTSSLFYLRMLAFQRRDLVAVDSLTDMMIAASWAKGRRPGYEIALRSVMRHGADSLRAAADSSGNPHMILGHLAADLSEYGRHDLARLLADSLATGEFSDQTQNQARVRLFRLDNMQGRPASADRQVDRELGHRTPRILVDRIMRDVLPGFQAPEARLRGLIAEVAAWDTLEFHLDPQDVMEDHYGELKAFLTGVLEVRLGDHDSVRARVDFLRSRPDGLTQGAPAYAFARSLEGLWDWRSGSLETALASLDEAQMQINDVCAVCSNAHSQTLNRFARAEIHFARQEFAEAIAWYGSLYDGFQHWGSTHRGFTYLRFAEIAESEGDSEAAARHYADFISLWRDAEPEFQPLVRNARDRLEALVREGVREPETVVTPAID